ncbi:ATP12 [Candida oxycetoniae]|uniref:ATP12 n=1 Tax=Candida oxycetoniae TaxID=497107 RepID=A0AAI9WY58_9ASCO|nr:ATP12 [Candida oxycetoniae]KAI3404937.2 ATP12 [Candida oxycetoniae]
MYRVVTRIGSRVICIRTLCSTRVIYQGSNVLSRASAIDKSIEHNIKSETNRLAKTGKRFWDKCGIHFNRETGKYEIQLDGKTLRTPLGFPLALPETKKQLAYLIVHEWTNIPNISVKSSTLPLTSLAARSIDLQNKHDVNEEAKEKAKGVIAIEDLKVSLLRYLDTDTCLLFSSKKDCDGKLRQKQNELYLPLIEEYNDFFTTFAHKRKLMKSDEKLELKTLDCEKDGLRGNKQSQLTQTVALNWMHELDIFELIALEKAILTTKSFLCGVSILRSNVSDLERMQQVFQINKETQEKYWYKSVEEIIELGDLETILQTGEWGEVEDTHDVDKRDWMRSLACAALVSH